jgi:hypothetical protein
LQLDNWNDLLHSAMNARCDIPDVGGCGEDIAVVFFYSFVLIAAFCLLNISVAVSRGDAASNYADWLVIQSMPHR